MSYIRFIDLWIPEGLKMRRYMVESNTSGTTLGQVQFYGAWRKFVFFPSEHTVFDTNCLNEIADFCRHLNDLRRGE